ncbi:hypothetical protein [Paenibacillus lautus]|uniref:hypothetical protein n=1 Tax=Paenibacillus lautus TaxID=1401 RepID=UPI001C7E05F6|nr:hypothetical protein [Paenibacillus lautus]
MRFLPSAKNDFAILSVKLASILIHNIDLVATQGGMVKVVTLNELIKAVVMLVVHVELIDVDRVIQEVVAATVLSW